MKPASMVSQTVNVAITLTCLISTTSSNLGLYSNKYLSLLQRNINSTGKVNTQKHGVTVASLAYTLKFS